MARRVLRPLLAAAAVMVAASGVPARPPLEAQSAPTLTFDRFHDYAAQVALLQQWAKASLSQSVWANAYWQRVQPRCRSTSHAYRCLGNRWLAILWKCWQTRQPYDEAYHLQRRAARNQTRG